MENLDVTVLGTLRDWRRAGRRALLATVVRTWGSSPRPAGSILALAEDGCVVGSVSGGCIEDDLIARHRSRISCGPPRFVTYGVSADEAHRFGRHAAGPSSCCWNSTLTRRRCRISCRNCSRAK